MTCISSFQAHFPSSSTNAKFSVVDLRQGVVIALDCTNNQRDFSGGKLPVAARSQTKVEAVIGAEAQDDHLDPSRPSRHDQPHFLCT